MTQIPLDQRLAGVPARPTGQTPRFGYFFDGAIAYLTIRTAQAVFRP